MPPAIELMHLSKTIKHKGKEVFKLSDLNLQIKTGDFFALLGPNGSGKTTLISILLGLMTPDDGKVKILGKNPLDKNALQEVNFLFTEQEEPWSLEVKDILNFYAEVYLVKEKKKKISEVAELLNIQHKINQPLYKLSSGERTRVMIARALINTPKVLILDEPTHNLDYHTADKLRTFLQELNRKRKTTILFTSHNPQEIEKIAKTVGFIKQGKLLEVLPLKKIKKKYKSIQQFIKRRSE